jgi:hypothetical protein
VTGATEVVKADCGFDYAALSPELAEPLRKQASRIRDRLRATVTAVIEVGRDLIAVRQQLPHGQFGDWVVAECRFSRSTACNYMKAAEFADSLPADKFPTVGNLPERTLYRLAAKSTPPVVVSDVIARAEAGELVTDESLKQLIAGARGEQKAVLKRRRRQEKVSKRTLGRRDAQKRKDEEARRQRVEAHKAAARQLAERRSPSSPNVTGEST